MYIIIQTKYNFKSSISYSLSNYLKLKILRNKNTKINVRFQEYLKEYQLILRLKCYIISLWLNNYWKIYHVSGTALK